MKPYKKPILGLSDNWIEKALQSRQFQASKNRLTAVARNEIPDRTPVVAFIDGYPAVLAGVPLKKYYTDVEASIRLQIQAKAFLDVDDSPSYGWADWGGWEFGGQIRFPETITEVAPRTGIYPVTELRHVDALEIPDPKTAGMFPCLAQFNRIIRSLGFPAKIRAGSVSSLVGSMVPMETLMKWIIKEPQALHCLFDKAAEFIIRAAEQVILTYGAENCSVFMSTPMDSNNLFSEKTFRTFSYPRIKKINDWLLQKGVKKFVVHLCGRHDHNLEAWTQLPWPDRTLFSIGEMELTKVAEAFEHRHIIGGNIDSALLALGSAREVYEQSLKCIEIGRTLPGGFILMPACSLSLITPPLNVHAMVQAASAI